MHNRYKKIIEHIDFDIQPIVNIKSGETFGVELFLRNYSKVVSFSSIHSFFQEMFEEKLSYDVFIQLLAIAIKKYHQIKIENCRLFFNVDYRIIDMPNYSSKELQDNLNNLDISKDALFLEISEKYTSSNPNYINTLCSIYNQNGYNVVIDNFATGTTGLQILYYQTSHFIKLDRFFMDEIRQSTQKRVFFKSLINMAHIKNIKVIATCIETLDEYFICKDLHIDFIQGNFIQKPIDDCTKLDSTYKHIKELYKSDQRESLSNQLDTTKIEKLKPLHINANLEELFLYFKQNPENQFVPIVNSLNELAGVVYEKDIKKLSYSQYGMSLAKNSNMNISIKKHLKDAVSAEITWSVDKILDIYNSTHLSKAGIFITKNNEYYGFVNLNNLLEISYTRNIEIARDQNPLTKLPGNIQIEKNIDQAFENIGNEKIHLVYFDFNDFKPFNDYYGFRQGDRAILIFSQILKKELFGENIFVGHIGGDDFFAQFNNFDYDTVYKKVAYVQEQFVSQVSSLYTKKDRENRYIYTKDRFNCMRKFDLLSVCASIIELSTNMTKKDFDELLHVAKESAKKSKIPLGLSLC
ncbi:MAG: EAL domain-containing protein [Campylobacterales bacterium]|nr:EAL domain-containing protein [Campylobacterales bacterium]